LPSDVSLVWQKVRSVHSLRNIQGTNERGYLFETNKGTEKR
jgi:hypothetical protein